MLIVGCQGVMCEAKSNCYRYMKSKSPIKIRGINNGICPSFMSISQGQDIVEKSEIEDKLFEEVIIGYGKPQTGTDK